MRLKFYILVVGLSGFIPVLSQQSLVDSLTNLIRNSPSDTTRVLLQLDLAAIYQFNQSDTALGIIAQAMKLAKEINYQHGEMLAICRRGEVNHLIGDLPDAVEDELTAIRLGQKNNYPDVEAESLTFLATIYLDIGENKQALGHLLRANEIFNDIGINSLFGGAKQMPPYTLLNIASAYEGLGKLDSAMFYYNASLNYPIKLDYQLQADLISRMGIIESRKKNFKDASAHFRIALKITQISNDLINRSVALYHLALIFKEQNKIDSALRSGSLAYQAAVKASYKIIILNASSMLATLHKEKKKLDSALFYQQIALQTKDSLFGLNKQNQLQALVLSEVQRIHKLDNDDLRYRNMKKLTVLGSVTVTLLFIASILLYSSRRQKKTNQQLSEKNILIEKQSMELKEALIEIKSTQSQLIQSEKMASLGELTAGIAHEIQNPLNFVNNFSEVSTELVDEMNSEIENGNYEEAKQIAIDLKHNLEKINHHGKRAGDIVKSMLQHSRTSSGTKEPTDINKLADEYLRLAYHGLRAKEKTFNAKIETHFDESLEKINVVPQDIGRVILNLITNAFYVVGEKKRQSLDDYEPTVAVSSRKVENRIEISVKDNGNGIPRKVLDKIFQPFFTTKPTGQGTGLGLSLSYDIMKAHGGELTVNTKEGEGSEFIIQLPIV